MLSLVVDRCTELLAAQPEPVLPPASIAAKRPASGAEVPAIVLAISIENTKGSGFARFIRSGDAVVKHTAVIEVRAAPEAFSADLRALQIAPLPLRKNPAAQTRAFSQEDIELRNVTDPLQTRLYRLTEQPTQQHEYRLEMPAAILRFGLPQVAGDKLEVVHWTVTHRDDILGDTYRGAMTFEIWANQINQADEIVRKLQARLHGNPALIRQKGFALLQPASLEPAEHVVYAPPTGSPFSVWQQHIGYRFVFAYEEGGELSSGAPIKQIDVDMIQPPESFSVR
jgi:hypothetical protein